MAFSTKETRTLLDIDLAIGAFAVFVILRLFL
jgi:hypothetical protein